MFRILFLLLLLFMAIVGGGGYWLYKYRLTVPLPLFNDIHYIVEPNVTLSEVAKNLMEKGLLDYPTALAWVNLARFQKRAHLIKAGEYRVPVGTTPQQLLDIMISGKTIQYTLTIPEGWNFYQLMTAVRAHPQLIQTLDGSSSDDVIMEKLGWPKQHPEGRFYPDTYLFPTRTTDVEFLQRAYKAMQAKLKAAWKQRDQDLPLKSPDEALVLASLIEKETAVAEERSLIAGVFIRRLKKNMLLQTDPTVIYALGKTFDGNIRKQDLKMDNPYNTYINKGLPPTPIAMPGKSALEAAVKPKSGDTLFFVAKGDGSHYFSTTYEEHECAVIEYQLKAKSLNRYYNQCKIYPNCAACRS